MSVYLLLQKSIEIATVISGFRSCFSFNPFDSFDVLYFALFKHEILPINADIHIQHIAAATHTNTMTLSTDTFMLGTNLCWKAIHIFGIFYLHNNKTQNLGLTHTIYYLSIFVAEPSVWLFLFSFWWSIQLKLHDFSHVVHIACMDARCTLSMLFDSFVYARTNIFGTFSDTY